MIENPAFLHGLIHLCGGETWWGHDLRPGGHEWWFDVTTQLDSELHDELDDYWRNKHVDGECSKAATRAIMDRFFQGVLLFWRMHRPLGPLRGEGIPHAVECALQRDCGR